MGTMALLRQVMHDADWYAKVNIKERDRALEAYIANKNLVQFFNAGKKVNTKQVNLVDKLFDEIAPKYADHNGGYTRIIKMGPRRGDGAEEVMIELV